MRGADKHYNGTSPYTGQKLWDVPVATEKDLEEAVTVARAAYKKWAKTPIEERRQALKALAKAISDDKEAWTKLGTEETGKPVCILCFDQSSL